MTKSDAAAAHKSSSSVISPTSEIIDELRNGRMVVLVDAEDRENEGDLVVPAQMATPDAVNFMAKYGRGLICLTVTQARARELGLDFMVQTKAARERTAFTQSIEAREGVSTGISAYDRARTIATAIDPTKGAADIVSPGHVFPLISREGGVLIRAGHTEATVDLSRLAGLYPAAVICEIMKDDGTMARMPDLIPFAAEHKLKIGTIEDLIAYRLSNESLVKEVARTRVSGVVGGAFDLHVFMTTVEPVEHLALVKGDLAGPGPVLVRVHAVNVLSDVLGIGETAGHESPVMRSMREIEKEGRGVVVLIRDLGAKSVSNWIERQQKSVSQHSPNGGASGRRQLEIGVGSQILRALGVSEMVLLTNAPADTYVGLDAYGLRISGTRAIA